MKSTFCALIALYFVTSFPVLAQRKSGVAGDRTSVDLTIYNQNLSLIREERSVNIPNGLSHIVIPNIPATIDGTSLHFVSQTDPLSVRVL